MNKSNKKRKLETIHENYELVILRPPSPPPPPPPPSPPSPLYAAPAPLTHAVPIPDNEVIATEPRSHCVRCPIFYKGLIWRCALAFIIYLILHYSFHLFILPKI